GGAQVDMAGDSGVVTGMAPSAEAHRGAAEAAAAAAGGNDKVVDMSQINTSGVVQVEVKVVELARSVMKDVGINFRADSGPWSGGVSLLPDLASGGMFGMLSYTSRDFSASLALLQNNGMARVLAEPTLLAMSGQSASFLAGGEIPIPVSAGLGTTSVQFKPFGIGLTVTPTVISRERIALKVAPEASELDYANGISSIDSNNRITVIPALRTRKADTMVELGDGETFVISGLVSRQTKASVNKVPLLGDLPIIGAFFRNVQYSQEDRELVIVVTPRLVRPIARGVTLPLPGARQEVSDAGFNAWGYYLLGPMSGQQMPGFSQ
ncbi:type II and III secretion system protein family protein, partial [Bordetella pertussis]